MFGQKTALLATLQGDRIWISIVLLNPRIRVSTTKLLNSVYAMVTYGIGVEFQRAITQSLSKELSKDFARDGRLQCHRSLIPRG